MNLSNNNNVFMIWLCNYISWLNVWPCSELYCLNLNII
jgi:hypothetical protein